MPHHAYYPYYCWLRTELSAIPGARQASRAWLSVSGQGEGLVISVTLDDPASQDAHQEVLDAVQRAVAAYAEPFYIRSSGPRC